MRLHPVFIGLIAVCAVALSACIVEREAEMTRDPNAPADVAAPIGVLNFFDLAAYLDLYNAQDPRADLAPPFGMLNFFDLATAIARYNAGCP